MTTQIPGWRVYCALMIALAFIGVAPELFAGDPIRFSKPDVEIASPEKKGPTLPPQFMRDKGTSVDVSRPPAEAPLMIPPEVLRPDRPRRKQDKVDKFFGTPEIFSDHSKEEKSDPWDRPEPGRTSETNRSGGKSFLKPAGLNSTPDAQRSLSPLTEFDGDDQKEKENRTSLFSPMTSKSTSKPLLSPGGLIQQNPFATKSETEEGNSSLSPVDPWRDYPLQNPFNALNKQMTREQQFQHRTESERFERLLSPASEPAGQTAGSLDPVKGLFSVPPQNFNPMNLPPALVPSALPKIEAPAQPFLAQQERLRAPSADDFAKRMSPSAAPTPSATPGTGPTAARPPLANQPTILEFPRRTF